MASKVTPDNLADLQFSAEHFNQVADFNAFLQGVIDRQEDLLSSRMGSIFDSSTPAIASQVKNASLCLCAAELMQLRINRLSGNIDADSVALIRALKESRKDYLQEASDVMNRLISTGGAADSGGYAGGTVVTDTTDQDLTHLWPGGLI